MEKAKETKRVVKKTENTNDKSSIYRWKQETEKPEERQTEGE